jgi:hypothetical protein
MQSFDVDTRRDRWRHTHEHRWHPDIRLSPIAAGALGRSYLSHLRGVLRDVGTASWSALAATVDRASATIFDGGRVFVAADPAGLAGVARHHGGQLAADPWLFVRLPLEGEVPAGMRPGRDDFVIALGAADPPPAPGSGSPGASAPYVRHAGRGVAWVISAYLTKPSDLAYGDIVIDQFWPPDDALVPVPGYDAHVGPASGVVSEAILWMLAAQLHANAQAFHAPSPQRRGRPR